MYSGPRHVKSMHNIGMLMLSFSTLALSLHTGINPPMKCAHMNATWDISQSTLYNQAYAWTHHQVIENWSYTSTKPAQRIASIVLQPGHVDVSDVFDECVKIQYRTSVKIPRFFFAYNKEDNQKVIVDKLVCVKNTKQMDTTHTDISSALEEKITLHNVPFVHSIDLVVSGKLQNNKVTLDANIDISIPWYLQILRLEIDKHVTDSLDEYLRLLVNDVCSTKLRKLAKQPHMHLHVQPIRRRFEQYA